MLAYYMRAVRGEEQSQQAAVAPELAEEKRLVEAACAGDKRALSTLLRKHASVLLRAVLVPRLGDVQSAEDALNESLMKACQNLERFEWQPAGIYPWLRTICVNTALDHLRKKKRLVLFDHTDPEAAPKVGAGGESMQTAPVAYGENEEQELGDLRARLDAQLAELNPRYALVIRARLVEGRSREAVAKELDVTVATFDVLFHRAMKALKAVVVNPKENESS